MENESIIYVPVKVLAMSGNLRKELPTVERLVDENGRLTVKESDLVGKATLTFARDGEPYVVLAESNIDSVIKYLKGLCESGLSVPKKSLEGTFCYAESLEDKKTSNLRHILGY